MPQLSATAFFCLWLTILAIGYIAVEILGGEKYLFRKSLERNKRHIFDRIIHYVIWWGVINLIFLLVSIKMGNINQWFSTLFSFEPIANNVTIKLGYDNITRDNVQFILFSIFHFIYITIGTIIGFYGCKLGAYLGEKLWDFTVKKVKKLIKKKKSKSK